MERSTLEVFVAGMPLLDVAREDATSRGLAHFAGQEPGLTDLQAWGESLRERAPHFFAPPPASPQEPPAHEQIPAWLSPAEKLARARQLGLTPMHDKQSRRPQDIVLTPVQQQELDKIRDPAARMNKYRQWKREAAQR